MSAREFVGDLLIVLAPILMLVGCVFAWAIIVGGEPIRYEDDQ